MWRAAHVLFPSACQFITHVRVCSVITQWPPEDLQGWKSRLHEATLSISPSCPASKLLPFSLWKHDLGKVRQASIWDRLPMPTYSSKDRVVSDWEMPTRGWWVLLLELCSEIPNLLCVSPLGRCASSCVPNPRLPAHWVH